MSKIGIIIGVLVLGAIVVFSLGGSSDDAMTPSSADGETVTTNEASSPDTIVSGEDTAVGSGTLKELAARDGSWKCTVQHETELGTSDGEVYVANGMVRADFVSVVPVAGRVETHMIARDGFTHTWTNLNTFGFKAAVATDATEASGEAVDYYSANLDYNCEPIVLDETRFYIPNSITFQEV